MSVVKKEKIEQACEQAKDKLVTLGIEETLVSEINWCLGSYSYDGNPVGLYEKAESALDVLKLYKKSHPRKVAKKLIEDLEKVISSN